MRSTRASSNGWTFFLLFVLRPEELGCIQTDLLEDLKKVSPTTDYSEAEAKFAILVPYQRGSSDLNPSSVYRA